jgi:hypothetical protein
VLLLLEAATVVPGTPELSPAAQVREHVGTTAFDEHGRQDRPRRADRHVEPAVTIKEDRHLAVSAHVTAVRAEERHPRPVGGRCVPTLGHVVVGVEGSARRVDERGLA